MDLLVIDTNFNNIAIIDKYDSLIWTERYNSCGDFELYMPADKEILSILKIDYYLWMENATETMIIEGIEIQTNAESGDHIIVTGRSLESILERRVLLPTVYIKNQNFLNTIKTLLNKTMIDPTDNDRRITNLIFENGPDVNAINNLMPNISVQYTGDSLNEVIDGLCQEFGVGYKIVLFNTNSFVFSLYLGKDRSFNQSSNERIVFSPEFENVLSLDFIHSNSSLKNVAYVGGQENENENKNRYWITVSNSNNNNNLNRREMYVDARDVSMTDDDGNTISENDYATLLSYRGSERLSEHNIIESFSGEANPVDECVYGVDFNLGDIVEVEDVYGNSNISRITEFTRSYTTEGFSFYPTFEMVE